MDAAVADRPTETSGKLMHRWRRPAGGGARGGLRRRAGAAVVLLGLLAGCATAGPDDAEPTARPATATQGPTVEQRAPAPRTVERVTVTDSSVVLGNPDAPQRIHVYQDLSCPHCQVLHAAMADDVERWAAGDDVAVEVTVVDYLGPRTTHGFSTRGAGLLALVADVHPVAWPQVQQALLDHQPTSTTDEVSDDVLLTTAAAAGIAVADLTAAEIAAYGEWVARATAEAAALGVNSIPQVFVAGTLVSGQTHDETAALVRQAVGE